MSSSSQQQQQQQQQLQKQLQYNNNTSLNQSNHNKTPGKGLPGFLRRSLRKSIPYSSSNDSTESKTIGESSSTTTPPSKQENNSTKLSSSPLSDNSTMPMRTTLTTRKQNDEDEKNLLETMVGGSGTTTSSTVPTSTIGSTATGHEDTNTTRPFSTTQKQMSSKRLPQPTSPNTINNNTWAKIKVNNSTNTTTTSSTTNHTSNPENLHTHSSMKTYKEIIFEKTISEQPVVNLSELKKLAWNGIPKQHRPKAWKLLLGYLPTNIHRRKQSLERKRCEYRDLMAHFYDIDDNSRTSSEQETLRQVLVDVPRTAPDIPLFRRQEIRSILSRLLYIWAMKHPASSYVQGINDLATPLIVVFLSEYAFRFYGFLRCDFVQEEDLPHAENKAVSMSNQDYHSNFHLQQSRLKLSMEQQGHTYDSNNDTDTSDDLYYCNDSIATFIVNQVLDGSMFDIWNKYSQNHHENNNNNNNTSSSTNHCDANESNLPSPQQTNKNQGEIHRSSFILPSVHDILQEVEADVYWCLTNILSGIQDHYTSDQPGVQRMMLRLEELVTRMDETLVSHLKETGIEFLQFAFKWMNCLLLREFTLPCIIRLWDTYFSEGDGGFETFHVYVCAAFLCHFSSQIQTMTFDELFGFMQNLPTSSWGDSEIEILLSQAYVGIVLLRGYHIFFIRTCVYNKILSNYYPIKYSCADLY